MMSSSTSPIMVTFTPVHTHIVKSAHLQLVTTAHMGIDFLVGRFHRVVYMHLQRHLHEIVHMQCSLLPDRNTCCSQLPIQTLATTILPEVPEI